MKQSLKKLSAQTQTLTLSLSAALTMFLAGAACSKPPTLSSNSSRQATNAGARASSPASANADTPSLTPDGLAEGSEQGDSDASRIFEYRNGTCVNFLGLAGHNRLPLDVVDSWENAAVSSYLREAGGECLNLAPSLNPETAGIIRGLLVQQSFDGIYAPHRTFEKLELREVSARGAEFGKSSWTSSFLLASDLSGAHFDGSFILWSEFERFTARDSSWIGAKLERTIFRGGDLRGAHFEDANLQTVAGLENMKLTGATFNCRTVLPWGREVAIRFGMVETACVNAK